MSQGGVAPALQVPAERGTGLLLSKLVAGEQALEATALNQVLLYPPSKPGQVVSIQWDSSATLCCDPSFGL